MFAASKTKGVSAVAANYIEDVFSTWLYTGNGSTQTINNGIDLSTKGGLVWTKRRSGAVANSHLLIDTARGPNNGLATDQNVAQTTGWYPTYFTGFTSTGYGVSGAAGENNATSSNYVSWTFREQPKFFDIVTYTGNGANRTISHNLGSVPGCIIVKRTDAAADWQVYHRSLANTEYLVLNTTAAKATGTTRWNSTTPTATEFSLGTDSTVNANGGSYIAYLFAHNAGGFGLTGTDNVISCGSFTTDGSGFVPDVNLGYEPQWILLKQTNSANAWFMFDNMRGWSQTNSQYLYANSSGAEASWNGAAAQYYGVITPTGFKGLVSSGINNGTFIYIAIRRGPMKTPTSGTSVYNGVLVNSSNSTQNVDAGWPVDLVVKDYRNLVNGAMWFDRLRGITSSTNPRLLSATTGAEVNSADINGAYQTGVTEVGIGTGYTSVDWFFRRAPSFFDVVCYTGTGSATTQAHNLGVAPELLIVKSRNTGATRWCVGSSALGGWGSALFINTNAAVDIFSGIQFNSTAPTSTVFTVGSGGETNVSAYTYVAYLFASCPGVSKVGSYTGTGALQTVNCGFTGGARFVLIKRTDSTGDWYVYDTARGMTVLTDPYLLLNSTAAESATLGSVITTSVGFIVDATILAAVNTNGASYIYLAIA